MQTTQRTLTAGRVAYAQNDEVKTTADSLVCIKPIIRQRHARTHHSSRGKQQEWPQTARMRLAYFTQTRELREQRLNLVTPMVEGQFCHWVNIAVDDCWQVFVYTSLLQQLSQCLRATAQQRLLLYRGNTVLQLSSSLVSPVLHVVELASHGQRLVGIVVRQEQQPGSRLAQPCLVAMPFGNGLAIASVERLDNGLFALREHGGLWAYRYRLRVVLRSGSSSLSLALFAALTLQFQPAGLRGV